MHITIYEKQIIVFFIDIAIFICKRIDFHWCSFYFPEHEDVFACSAIFQRCMAKTALIFTRRKYLLVYTAYTVPWMLRVRRRDELGHQVR